MIPNQEFTIVSCDDCGFRFLNPRPDENSIVPFYESEDYDPFLSTKNNFSLGDTVYSMVREYSLWRKRLLIESFFRSGRSLDVGCGTGEFLHTLQKYGWQVEGVEAAEHSRMHVRKFGIPVYPSLGEVPPGTYQVVTLWHVLEHLHRLNESVDQLQTHIAPGGVLIIAVPNVESWDAKRYQESWIALDTPRHLYHFDALDVQKLFSRSDLRLIETRGLWLDTIYNVLYSEPLKRESNRKRFRPFYVINTIIGSYIHDYQSRDRRASASVYIFRKEPEHE